MHSVTEPLRNVAERCETLQDITEALWIPMERYGSVTEPLRNVTERYGTVTENIDFAYL